MRTILFLISVCFFFTTSSAQTDHEAQNGGGLDFWNGDAGTWRTDGIFDGQPDCSSPPATVTIPSGVNVVLRNEVVTVSCAVNLIIQGILSIRNTDGTTTNLALGSGSTITVESGGALNTANSGGSGDHAENSVFINGYEVWNGAGNNDFSGDGETYGEGEILPIELLYFEANQKDNVIAITWSTVTELNNDYFTVNRSRDGILFEEIGRVDGADNTSAEQNYSVIDPRPIDGVSYYRLKQTDHDGQFEEFDIVSVYFNKSLSVPTSIYPNPGDQFAFLDRNVSIESISVYDMSGRNITSHICLKKLGNAIQLDLSSLQKGKYLVRDGHTVHRLLKRQ